MLYACDETWWIEYFPKVSTGFPGELWTVAEGARDRFDLRWIHGMDMGGLSKDPSLIHTGKNSGTQAIGLAHVFGAARIVLVGYDMSNDPSGRKHWHPDHPRGLGNGGSGRYPAWISGIDLVHQDLKRLGIPMVNASRRTMIRSVPRMTLEDALT